MASVAAITQAEKSYMSRLRNQKLATTGQGTVYERLCPMSLEETESVSQITHTCQCQCLCHTLHIYTLLYRQNF